VGHIVGLPEKLSDYIISIKKGVIQEEGNENEK
jgi:hypothetical protein